MKWHQHVRIARFELSDIERLWAAWPGVWAQLRFAADGTLVAPLPTNPSSGLVPQIRLETGSHRATGARYLVRGGTPKDGVGATWVPVDLLQDDAVGFALRRVADSGQGAVTVRWKHATRPTFEIAVDDPGPAVTDGPISAPRSRGAGTGLVDTAAAITGGPVVTGSGWASMFAGRGRVTVDEMRADAWTLTVDVGLHGRGVWRPLLAIAGPVASRFVGRELNRAMGDVAGEEQTTQRARALAALHAEIDRAGGPEAYVIEALWTARD